MFRYLTSLRLFSPKHGRTSKEVPKRSSNTIPRRRKLGRPYKNDFQVIVTLDPNKFAEKKQQRLHIGDLQSFRPHVSLLKQSSPVLASRFEYDMTRKTDTRARPSYPPGTRAFLYYSMSPDKPRIAGELRLRVAPSDDPASFKSGSDLLLTNGQPWSRPLYALSKIYFPLYEKLREERLVPDDLDKVLSTLSIKNPRYRRNHLLYSFNDTFIVDFSSAVLIIFVITEQGVARLPFLRQFTDCRKMCRYSPYTGRALVRFERSTLLDHEGTRTVVLRFLRIITPVKCVIPSYDDYLCFPKEGELYRRRNADQPVWSVNIDKSKSALIPGLQLLWDA